MIFQTEKLPDWTSEHAATLRLFLQSETGIAAIALVVADRPELLDGADSGKTLVASGQVKGFTSAIESLFRLTYEQPVIAPVSTEYPDLDDEKAWGQAHQTTNTTNQNGRTD